LPSIGYLGMRPSRAPCSPIFHSSSPSQRALPSIGYEPSQFRSPSRRLA
jgi:hypothetical protein